MRRPLLTCAFVSVAVMTSASIASGSIAESAPVSRYYLHMHTPDGDVGDTFHIYMDTRDHPDTGNGSGTLYDGAPNDVFQTTGAKEPVSTEFPAMDALPLRPDVSRPVTGRISLTAYPVTVGGHTAFVGGGAARLELTLAGRTTAGKEVVLGRQEIPFTVTPLQSLYELDVRIVPAGDARGEKLSSVVLSTVVRGPSLLAGFFELDDPPSYVEIPVLPKRSRP